LKVKTLERVKSGNRVRRGGAAGKVDRRVRPGRECDVAIAGTVAVRQRERAALDRHSSEAVVPAERERSGSVENQVRRVACAAVVSVLVEDRVRDRQDDTRGGRKRQSLIALKE